MWPAAALSLLMVACAPASSGSTGGSGGTTATDSVATAGDSKDAQPPSGYTLRLVVAPPTPTSTVLTSPNYRLRLGPVVEGTP